MNKIFDCNTMIGDRRTKLKFSTPSELVKIMDRYGIEKALVHHSLCDRHDPKEGNVDLLKDLQTFQKRLLPVFTLCPTSTLEIGDAKQIINSLKKNKVKAVRFAPASNNYEFKDWLLKDIFGALSEQKIPIFIARAEISNFEDIYNILVKHPRLKIVLVNTTYTTARNYYQLLEKFRFFHVDTSNLSHFNGIKDIVERFGSERIIFGTGMPFLEPGRALAAVKYAPISEKDRENIYFKNLEKIIK